MLESMSFQLERKKKRYSQTCLPDCVSSFSREEAVRFAAMVQMMTPDLISSINFVCRALKFPFFILNGQSVFGLILKSMA